ECDHCGRVPMALRLVHYTWSVKWEFRGQIIGLCPQCDRSTILWACTGWKGRIDPERVEKPACDCGGTIFHLVNMDRFEESDFYDDGVIAGCCVDCGACRVIANFD
ncbi:MAG: hypothetical protein ACREK5_09755, partial [Gemmatimonadota bacterium]